MALSPITASLTGNAPTTTAPTTTAPTTTTTTTPPPPPPVPTSIDLTQFKWLGDNVEPAQAELAQKKGWTNPLDMLKGYDNLERLFGSKASVVPRPKDDAPKADWDAYRTANGRPADAKAYGLAEALGDAVKAKPEFANAASEWFLEAGLDAQQAKTVASKYLEMEGALQAKEDADFIAASNADVQTLATELGGKFEDTMEVARRATQFAMKEAGLKAEDLDKLERAIGTKTMLTMFSKFGNMGLEATALNGEGGKAFETKEYALAQIAKLRTTPEFLTRYQSTNQEIRNTAIAEMEKWQKQAYGDAPVGA